MAMLTLNGIVQNAYTKPASTDPKTGEVRPASDHAQILAENFLETGEKRLEMVSLKVRSAEVYRLLQGKPVRVPVGVFARGNEVVYYALKNEPDPVVA